MFYSVARLCFTNAVFLPMAVPFTTPVTGTFRLMTLPSPHAFSTNAQHFFNSPSEEVVFEPLAWSGGYPAKQGGNRKQAKRACARPLERVVRPHPPNRDSW